MLYWLSSNDIQEKELELMLDSELKSSDSFIYLTATQNIKQMRLNSVLLAPTLKSKPTSTFIEFLQSISSAIYHEQGILSNSDQRYILAKTINWQYKENEVQRKATYALRNDLFDLFQTLMFNDKQISAENHEKIRQDYSEVEADIFNLFYLFRSVIKGICCGQENEDECKTAKVILGEDYILEENQTKTTYLEQQKYGIKQAIEKTKTIVFDGFLFLNEMQKFVLNESIQQNKRVYFIAKQFNDGSGEFIFEHGIKAAIPENIEIKKYTFRSEYLEKETALSLIKNKFPSVVNADLDKAKLETDGSMSVIAPFIGREEELRYVALSISRRLKAAYNGNVDALINMINNEVAIIIAIDKEKYEDRISKIFREIGLFIYNIDLIKDTIFFDVDESTVNKVYFEKAEYLLQTIKRTDGTTLDYQEKLRFFDMAFNRIEINKFQRPIASYPIGQFVLEIYRLINDGISVDGFQNILYSNWRYIQDEKEQEKWSDYLSSFRFLVPYLEGTTNLQEWIAIIEHLINIKPDIDSDNLYVYHPLKIISSDNLQAIYKLLLHISDLMHQITKVKGNIRNHLEVLKNVVMNSSSVLSQEDERIEFEQTILKRLTIAVNNIGGNSLISNMEANYFAQNIRAMLTEWETENAIETESFLKLNVVNLENMKHYKHCYFIMCEASKYPRRYFERFPYTQEIIQILKNPKYGLEYSPQDLKGIDYHLKLERYLFKNVLDFTTNSITFTYCEKEHNSHNYPSIFIEDIATAFNSDIIFSSVTQKTEISLPSEQVPKPLLMGRKQHYSLTELALFKLCPKLYYHWESSNNKSAYLSKIQLKFYFEAILFCDLFDRFMDYNLEKRKVYQKVSNEYQAIIKSLWNDCIKYHSQYFSFFNEYEKQDMMV